MSNDQILTAVDNKRLLSGIEIGIYTRCSDVFPLSSI
jgi:hypothetical protein